MKTIPKTSSISPFKLWSLIGFLFVSTAGFAQQAALEAKADPLAFDGKRITRSQDEWKALLTPDQYRILREKGTERAFTSPLNKEKGHGIFTCAACGLPLFSSDKKFESGTGWPSFWAPVSKKNIRELADNSYGMQRVEVECNRCGGHLGHVFEDGPKPTGLRYCINGKALTFKANPSEKVTGH